MPMINSERFCDHERVYNHERTALYVELVQSSLDRPQGGEQAFFLDQIAHDTAVAPFGRRHWPKLSLRWLALPQLPVPFLTWA